MKLIICDLDGTLVDTEWVYQSGWAEVLKEYGHEFKTEDFAHFRGQSTAHNSAQIEKILGSKEVVEQARAKREAYYYEQLQSGAVHLLPGVKELLVSAQQAGVLLAVATSSYKERAVATLEQFDLLDYFQYAVFGDEVELSKPDPEIYLTVLKAAGIASTEAVALEDSKAGLMAAANAGLTVCVVPGESMDTDNLPQQVRLFEDLHAVKQWLKL